MDRSQRLQYECITLTDALIFLMRDVAKEENLTETVLRGECGVSSRTWANHKRGSTVRADVFPGYLERLCKSEKERLLLQKHWDKTNSDAKLGYYTPKLFSLDGRTTAASLKRLISRTNGDRNLIAIERDRDAFREFVEIEISNLRAKGQVEKSLENGIGMLRWIQNRQDNYNNADYEHRIMVLLNHIIYHSYINENPQLMKSAINFIEDFNSSYVGAYAATLLQNTKSRFIEKFTPETDYKTQYAYTIKSMQASDNFINDRDEFPYLYSITNLRATTYGDAVKICAEGPNELNTFTSKHVDSYRDIWNDTVPISVDQSILMQGTFFRAFLAEQKFQRAEDVLQKLLWELHQSNSKSPLGWATFYKFSGDFFDAQVNLGESNSRSKAVENYKRAIPFANQIGNNSVLKHSKAKLLKLEE